MKELPKTYERPWGWFREFAKNEPVTVKIIFIKKGEVFSLQRHHLRIEFWRVLSGNPDVIIGDHQVRANAGDEFEIPVETSHRIASETDDSMVLEVSRGEFDENDIVRVEDKYGRT